jgi:hypothetical protein
MAGLIDMATTPNYGWPIPVATDYVKDGYANIADLGDAIDATVFGLGGGGGLTLISTTTIGTTVSSVNVTSAFSATYDNYKIMVSGGVGSTATYTTLKLGATATGYYSAQAGYTYGNSVASVGFGNQATFNRCGYGSSDTIFMNCELQNPFNAKFTVANWFWNIANSTGEMGVGGGALVNTTSYTDFTIAPTSGTLTGGTIRVYGYKNS